MTWSINFKAKSKHDAKEIIAADRDVPLSIMDYITSVIHAMPPGEMGVSVNAYGHTQVFSVGGATTAMIKVEPLVWKSPE